MFCLPARDLRLAICTVFFRLARPLLVFLSIARARS